MQGFHPIGWREASLEHKATDDVISSADNAFSFFILGGSVGAWHAKSNAMGEEKGASGRVIKFLTIVTLDAFDGG